MNDPEVVRERAIRLANSADRLIKLRGLNAPAVIQENEARLMERRLVQVAELSAFGADPHFFANQGGGVS